MFSGMGNNLAAVSAMEVIVTTCPVGSVARVRWVPPMAVIIGWSAGEPEPLVAVVAVGSLANVGSLAGLAVGGSTPIDIPA